MSMLRALCTVCMAWMIIMNSMVYSVICVNFQLNRSIIAAMFCENKEDPMSSCQGQCYLNKQMDSLPHQQEADWMDFRSDFNLFTLANPPIGNMACDISYLPKPSTWMIIPAFHCGLLGIDKPPKI